MNPFKKLAGQTAVYGLGTMVPRLLNYLLVPLHTRIFLPEVYGQLSYLYAYIALFLALLTYGMETTFFRHGKGADFKKVYGNIMTCILSTTGFFLVLLVCCYPLLADAIDFHDKGAYVLFTGLIVAFDAIAAVPFCVLRQQDKSFRFALIKVVNVCVNVLCNLFFLLVIPETATRWSVALFGPGTGLLAWVFVSNLFASLVSLLMLLPQLRLIRLQFDFALVRRLLSYAIPIMLISLIGMVNEVADKIVVGNLLSESELGIYSANYKLAVLMTIFVQMFRFASEPFFFGKAEDRNSPSLFADVMLYFVICGLVIFLAIVLFVDVFGYFLGNSASEFRQGLGIVPIVLMANLFLGITFNLSIWYKLSDRTSSGTVITAVGAVVTLACLFGLVPIIGYWGAAVAHLACYSVMMVVSYVWGQRVYPIPYNVKRIAGYVAFALLLYFLNLLFVPDSKVLKYLLSAVYFIVFCVVAFRFDLKNALKN